jgi:hypothetical protein
VVKQPVRQLFSIGGIDDVMSIVIRINDRFGVGNDCRKILPLTKEGLWSKLFFG